MRFLYAWRTCVLCLLFGISFRSASAATYYLSPSGNDLNPGTASAPWKTLVKASKTLLAGDTVLLNDGDYVGGVSHSRSGTALAPITYQAVHPGKAVVRGDLTTATDAFEIHDCSYVNILGLEFYKGNRAGLRITTGHHVTVQQCVARYCVTWGIFTSFMDDVVLEYNKCYNSTEQHGIYVSNSGDRPVVRYNTCYNNPRAGIQLNGDASMLKPVLGTQGDGIIDGAVVEGNTLYGNGLSAAAAINLMSVRNSLIANNLLYNNKQGGISMSDDQDGVNWGCKNNRILHNTVYFKPTEGRWCLSFKAGSTGNVVQNNVLWGGYRGAYQFDDSSDFDADYNVLRERSDVGVATNETTSKFYSFSAWKTFSACDTNSSVSDPRFVQPTISPYNYRLVSGSPGIDKAKVQVDVTDDLTGLARPLGTAPDMGAYEGAFAPAAPTSLVATAGTLSASLTWKASSTGSTYTVKRALTSSGPFVTVATGLTKTSYVDSGLLSAVTYYYVVSATNGGMESKNSKVASLLVP